MDLAEKRILMLFPFQGCREKETDRDRGARNKEERKGVDGHRKAAS